jgi:ParB family transcriptional regulator, chromosome partitioning protein
MASRLDGLKRKDFGSLTAKKPIIPKKENKEIEETYEIIGIDLIDMESNIRSEYNDDDINDLSDSIKQYGQLEPIRVFETKNKYIIIFGHRRYLACKKAGVINMKCIVSEKPDSLDKIYIQAVENEHSVNISSIDREKYVSMLFNKYNQSVEDISKKLHKSTTWIYTALNANKIRNQYEDIFNDSGLQLNTRDTALISNSNEEDVKEAVSLIVENPGNKTKILQDLSNNNKKKKGSRTSKINVSPKKNISKTSSKNVKNDISKKGSDKLIKNDISLNDNSDSNNIKLFSSDEVFKSANIEIKLQKYDNSMKMKIKASILGDFFDSKIIPLLLKNLESYYNNEGYTIER